MYIYHIFVDLFVSVYKTCCYHYWISHNAILRLWWEKHFIPHSVSVDMRGSTERAFLNLWRFLFFLYLILLYQAMWFLNFLPNNSLSCFCRSAAFSFSIVFTCYCKFMIHPKTFNLLWYVMALLLCPRKSTICST